MSDDQEIAACLPSGWAEYLPMITALVRDALKVAGAAGFTWALTVNASHVQMAVSAAMIAASALWSQWQKIQAQRALKTAAVQPAGMAPPNLPA